MAQADDLLDIGFRWRDLLAALGLTINAKQRLRIEQGLSRSQRQMTVVGIRSERLGPASP